MKVYMCDRLCVCVCIRNSSISHCGTQLSLLDINNSDSKLSNAVDVLHISRYWGCLHQRGISFKSGSCEDRSEYVM